MMESLYGKVCKNFGHGTPQGHMLEKGEGKEN